MTDFLIDTSEMKTLTKTLRKADKVSLAAFYRGIETGGELVRARAEQNIAPYSKTIRGTGRVVRRGNNVRIAFGAGDFPTKAFENRGRPGNFRHPVFGNRDNWVAQPAHPFLIPAAHQMEPAVVSVVGHAIETAFRGLGF